MPVCRRRVLAAITLAVMFVLAVGACGSSSGPYSTGATVTAAKAPHSAAIVTATTAAPTSLAVRRITETFVDRTRPTVDPDHIRSAPNRTLVTDIYVPGGKGPYPLILHAHGASGDAGKFTLLAEAWARSGYVVAVPTFPLTSDESGGSVVIADYVNQPGDLHFVLDQVLHMAATPNTPLTGEIDTHHIGLSGLSLGGATAYGLAFNTCCRDPRITALIIMSGIKLAFGDHPWVSDKPILIFHGTADPTIPYATAGTAYASVAPPKYFVTLLGARHAPQYEDTPDPHDRIVITVTLDFWDAYLKGQEKATAHLLTDGNQPPLSSMTSAP